jgi:hypothetical protein
MNAFALAFVSVFLFISQLSGSSMGYLQSRFHVCTIATYAHPNLEKLKKSCRKNKIHLKVLGMGRPYHGNATKFVYMTEYLDDLQDDNIVMFVDAFDVIVVAEKKKILSKFLAMKTPILMGAETNCTPHPQLLQDYPLTESPFKYVNTGTFIGYVKDLKEWLAALQPIDPHDCDQGIASLQFVNCPDNRFFTLDYKCDLFLPLYGVPESFVEIDEANRKVHCIPTDSHPCVIHANGTSFTIWNKVYDSLVVK